MSPRLTLPLNPSLTFEHNLNLVPPSAHGLHSCGTRPPRAACTHLPSPPQDPLQNEGNRNSRYIRMVAFSTATGQATAQYVYPLDTVAEINARIAGTPRAAFTANQQVGSTCGRVGHYGAADPRGHVQCRRDMYMTAGWHWVPQNKSDAILHRPGGLLVAALTPNLPPCRRPTHVALGAAAAPCPAPGRAPRVVSSALAPEHTYLPTEHTHSRPGISSLTLCLASPCTPCFLYLRCCALPCMLCSQGRNIGVSSLSALNAYEILVLERDNRGVGADTTLILNQTPAAHKRIYKVDIRSVAWLVGGLDHDARSVHVRHMC